MESRAAGAPSAQCYAGTGGRGQPEPGPLPGRSLASRTGLFGECSRPATWKVARQPGAGQGSADARRQVWGTTSVDSLLCLAAGRSLSVSGRIVTVGTSGSASGRLESLVLDRRRRPILDDTGGI
jgi:hypothetical protein